MRLETPVTASISWTTEQEAVQTTMSMNEPVNEHSWSDGKNTVSISTDIDKVIAMSERATKPTSGGVPYSESAEHTTTQWIGRFHRSRLT